MTILEDIFAHKRAEVARRKDFKPLQVVRLEAEAAPAPLDFVKPLVKRDHSRPALIAEVKRGSPSRGLLARDYDPLRLSRHYRQNGAAAISVLTDERFFGGCLPDLALVVRDRFETPLPPLPVLRKDFLCDPYQVYEACAAGADAVLLITAALEPVLLRELHTLAIALGMAPLVEIHAENELEKALKLSPVLIGINNRDLRDFSVDLGVTRRLRPEIPAGIAVVAESGIRARADVDVLAAARVDAILVGEALVAAEDTAAKTKELSGYGYDR